jgi:hypothetical protein
LKLDANNSDDMVFSDLMISVSEKVMLNRTGSLCTPDEDQASLKMVIPEA